MSQTDLRAINIDTCHMCVVVSARIPDDDEDPAIADKEALLITLNVKSMQFDTDNILEAGGRERHHGLKGMHERASLIRGKLEVWSKPGFGCEVELTVPAPLAYAAPHAGPHTGQRRVS